MGASQASKDVSQGAQNTTTGSKINPVMQDLALKAGTEALKMKLNEKEKKDDDNYVFKLWGWKITWKILFWMILAALALTIIGCICCMCSCCVKIFCCTMKCFGKCLCCCCPKKDKEPRY